MSYAKASGTLTVPVTEFQSIPRHVRGLVGARVDFYVFNKNPRTSMNLEAL